MHTDFSQNEAVVKRYKAKYKFQDVMFRVLDVIAHPLRAEGYSQTFVDKTAIRKILVVNGGHIGDVVISTALLPLLQKAIPGVSIGFLTGTYSSKVIEKHPNIARIHFIDHWYLTRSSQSRMRSVWNYHRQRQKVIRELQAENYDIAIELRAWFPNFISVLYEAHIPIRIGYDRVGGRPLLTHSYKYQYDRRHELHHQLDLLKPLNLDPDLIKSAWPCLPNISEDVPDYINALLYDQRKFCILHPASSTPTRDWPQQNWIRLAQNLVDHGIVPVITGKGRRDAAMAEEISSAVPSAINLCNSLSWEGLVSVIRKAEVVYSVETSIGHIASALGRPVISIYGGMADPMHWAPLGAHIVTNLLPCHPCFRKQGCLHRSCLTGITVDQVESHRK